MAGEWGFIGKGLAFAAQKWTQFVHRTGDRLEAEKADLRADLIELLKMLEQASVEAQTAVRGSSNEPAAQTAHAEAIKSATKAGQRVANLFQAGRDGPLPHGFLDARLAFREAVTDEDNLSLALTDERQAQTDRIERSCAVFHNEICEEAFRRFGQGLGPRSGILKGRKVKR